MRMPARLGRRPAAAHQRFTVDTCRPLRTSPSSAAASPAPRWPTSWRRPARWSCWRPRRRSAATRRPARRRPGSRGTASPAVRALITAVGPRFAGSGRRARRAAAARAPRRAVDGARRRRRGGARRPGRRAGGRAGRARPRRPRRGPAALPGAARRSAPRRSPRRRPTSTSPRLHDAYVRGLRARGGTVRTSARVVALRRDGAGWRIGLADGDDRCSPARSSTRPGRGRTASPRWPACRALGLTPLRRTIAVARVPDPTRLRPPDGGPLPMVVRRRWTAGTSRPTGRHLLVSPADETPVGARGRPSRGPRRGARPGAGRGGHAAWGCARS